jgi:hypothetical protein
MHMWQFHAQWEQHAWRSSMLGGAAFLGAHSMPRERAACPGKQHPLGGHSIPKGSYMPGEAACSRGHTMSRGSSIPGEAACSGGHIMPEGAACPGKQHSQGETAFPGGAACPEKQHAQGGSIKGLYIAHLQFHVKVLCITLLLCAAPPGMQLPCPQGMLSPGILLPLCMLLPSGQLLPPGIAAPPMESLQ